MVPVLATDFPMFFFDKTIPLSMFFIVQCSLTCFHKRRWTQNYVAMGQLCDVMFPPVNYGSNNHVSTMSQAQDAQFNDVAFWSNSPGIIESEEEEESEEEDDLGALSDNSDFEYFGGDNDGGEKRPESGGEVPREEGGGSEGSEGFVLDQAPMGKDEAKNAEEEPHEEEQVPHEEQQEEKQGHDVQEETQEKTEETEQDDGTDRAMVAGKVVGGNGGKKEGNGGKKGVVAGVALVGGNGKC
jgi:hypothetical protein